MIKNTYHKNIYTSLHRVLVELYKNSSQEKIQEAVLYKSTVSKKVDLTPLLINYSERKHSEEDELNYSSFPNGEYKESPKKRLESLMTSNLNSPVTYYTSIRIFNYIMYEIKRALQEDSKYVGFLVKGGMGAKMLLYKYNNIDSIEDIFGLGDNDTSVFISPNISETKYNTIKNTIIRTIYSAFDKVSIDMAKIYNTNKNTYFDKRSVKIDEKNYIFNRINGCTVEYIIDTDNNVNVITTYGRERFFRSSHSYISIKEHNMNFDLLRLKIPYVSHINGKSLILNGEFLDISIPTKDSKEVLHLFGSESNFPNKHYVYISLSEMLEYLIHNPVDHR